MSGFLSNLFEGGDADQASVTPTFNPMLDLDGGVVTPGSDGSGDDGAEGSGSASPEASYWQDGQDQETAQSGEGSTSTQSVSGDATAGVDLALTVGLQTGMDWETEDGSGGWARTDQVTLDTSTDALLGSTTDLTQADQSSEG